MIKRIAAVAAITSVSLVTLFAIGSPAGAVELPPKVLAGECYYCI